LKPIPSSISGPSARKRRRIGPAHVEIGFERGDPVSIDGKKLSPAALLTELNELGRANGIGRLDLVENRFVGMKSRGVTRHRAGRSSTSRIAASSQLRSTAARRISKTI